VLTVCLNCLKFQNSHFYLVLEWNLFHRHRWQSRFANSAARNHVHRTVKGLTTSYTYKNVQFTIITLHSIFDMHVRCYIILKGGEPYQLLSVVLVNQFQRISRGLIKQEELLLNSIKVLFSWAILISLYANKTKTQKQ